MRVPRDILSPEDIDLLQETARRILPNLDEIVREWTDAWVEAVPVQGADVDSYRQMISYTIQVTLSTTFGFLAQRDVSSCYEFQYNSNREYAHSQVPAGEMPVFSQRDMWVVSRLGQPILTRWITQLWQDQPQRVPYALLAQERMGGQMAGVLSEAYGDEREARLRSISDRLRVALEQSEQLRGLGQAVAQSLEPESVIDLTLRTAMDLLGAESALLTLADRSGSELQVRGVAGNSGAEVGGVVAIDRTLHGMVFRTNHWLKAPPLPSGADLGPGELPDGAVLLVVPLRAAARPIGTLGVRRSAAQRISKKDAALLQSVADSVATALENSRVHAEVRAALAEADRANRAKSEFITAVSHEVRSPLSTLFGYIDLLRDGAFGEVSQEQAEILDRLQVVSRAAVRLTDDLLEHARIDAAMLKVRPEVVALGEVLDEVGAAARVMLRDRDVEFHATVAVDASHVKADPLRLRQILTNLVGNAAKFTSAGSIRVSAVRADADRVRIDVTDTGPGIHPNDLPRVFDLFYRADGNEKVSGSGIGLSVSQRLAQLMQGELCACSELGKGSTFTLRLPLAQP